MRLSATVDGMTLSDPPTDRWALGTLDGWTDGAPVRGQSQDRPAGHGAFGIPNLRGSRIVTISGSVVKSSPVEVGTVRAALAAVLGDGDFGDLTVTEPDGTTTTASVQINAAPLVRWNARSNTVEFQLQFLAPDPLRYGATQNLVTGFADLTGGLEFDLFTDGTTDTGYMEFGPQGSTGQVTVDNPGTAPAWPQFYAQGPTPPFDIVNVGTGERLTFSRALSAAETLLIDSATGMVGLGASAVDYSGYLTRAEWFSVPRKGSATIAFVPQGAYDVGTLTVIHRPAWW